MGNIDELISKLAQDAPAARPAPHPVALSMVWIAAAAVYLGMALMISGLRPDLPLQLQRPWFIAEIVALAGILASASLSAALLSFPDLHQMRKAALTPLVLFAVFLLLMLFSWHADNPPAPLPVHSFECTLSIILVALLPAAGMLYAMRRFASTHYHWAGAIALIFAFSIGALWLRLHEINDSIMHVIEWHYLPMIGFGIVGLWLGKVILKW
jgi:hypothetical protein